MSHTTLTPADQVQFEYRTTNVGKLTPIVGQRNGRPHVTGMELDDGKVVVPTSRFWTSFFAKWGFGNSTFKWFDHLEVFQRIAERAPSDVIRICIEQMDLPPIRGGDGAAADGKPKLLAISNPASVLVQHNDLLELLADHGIDVDAADYGQHFPVAGGSIDPHGLRIGHVGGNQHGAGGLMPFPAVPDLTYQMGVVRSVHTPRNSQDFQILGDMFSNRFVLDTPIDGYGKPSIYLMLLRQICSNGSIGYSRVFRADLSLGKGEDSFEYALTRAFEGYNNEEGFGAIRQRYESAGKSWASIQEINKVYKSLIKLHHNGEVRVGTKFLGSAVSSFKDDDGHDVELAEGSPIIQSFHRLCGDLTKTYGLANLDALGKRQRALPAGCSIYELLNFVSEVATHHTTPAGSRALQALTGDFLSAEYDLEGTKDKFGEWQDFLIADKAAIAAYAEAQKPGR